MNDVIRDYTEGRVTRLVDRVDDEQVQAALAAIAAILDDLGRQVNALQHAVEEYLR